MKKIISIATLVLALSLPFKSSAELLSECADSNYLYSNADVIIYGQVKNVQTGPSSTDVTVTVSSYVTKGSGASEIHVITGMGTNVWAEDTPSFKVGDKGYLYLKFNGPNYSPFCGQGFTSNAPSSVPSHPSSSDNKGSNTVAILSVIIIGGGLAGAYYLLKKRI